MEHLTPSFSNPILRVQNVVKRFGNYRALDDLSFDVPANKITLFLGPNGSGKTTMVNCISGVYKPDQGKILFNGIDTTKLPAYEVTRLGIVRSFQVPGAFRHLSAFENVMTSLTNEAGESLIESVFSTSWMRTEQQLRRQAMARLSDLDLSKKGATVAGELSGGQMKLLENSRVLAKNAKLYLLDEPVGSVNPVLAHRILDRICNMRDKQGATFVIVEHRLDIVMRYVDHVCALFAGKIICEGKPDSVLANKEMLEGYLGERKPLDP